MSLKNDTDELDNKIKDLIKENDLPSLITSSEELPANKLIIHNPDDLTKIENNAKKIVNGLFSFFTQMKWMDKNDYIQSKMNLQRITLQSIIKQTYTLEKLIGHIIYEIETNSVVNNENIQSLVQLQNTYMNLVKLQTQYITQIEEDAKKSYNDHKDYGSVKSLQENGNDGVFTGTRDLIKKIKGIESE